MMDIVKKGSVVYTKDQVIFTIPEYKTHIRKTKTKFVKVNGQAIYSGMNHHTRNKITRGIKDSIIQSLPDDIPDLSKYLPGVITLDMYNVPNFQTVKYMSKKGEFAFKGVDPDVEYEPTFDVDNQWIWIKCFTDVIAKDLNLIPDDTVKYIPGNGSMMYHPIDKLKNRKLVYKLTKIKDQTLLDNFNKFYGKI